MSDLALTQEETRIAGMILKDFLVSGLGTPARNIRIELGKSRGVLDDLQSKRVVRLLDDTYYPLYLSREALGPSFRDVVERCTGLALRALAALFREGQKDQFVFAEVLAKCQELDLTAREADVRLGMLMATEFGVYCAQWSLGRRDSPQSGQVMHLEVREKILDYETLEQAWQDELENRMPHVDVGVASRRGDRMNEGSRAGGVAAGRERGLVTERDLHPWPIILSIISGLSSDGVVELISATGLQVDWALSKEQAYSHKTRVREYLQRIQIAFDLLSKDRQLIVSALAASSLSRSSQERGKELDTRLSQIGWRLESDRLSPVEPTLRELFFPKGSQHDAYVEIRSILQGARRAVFIVDPYLDGSVFQLLATIEGKELEVRLLSSKLPGDFPLEATKFVAQHDTFRVEIRRCVEFHDRFIVLDGTACYHIGASLKDAGLKVFMINQIEDGRNRDALLEQLGQSWQGAEKLFPGGA